MTKRDTALAKFREILTLLPIQSEPDMDELVQLGLKAGFPANLSARHETPKLEHHHGFVEVIAGLRAVDANPDGYEAGNARVAATTTAGDEYTVSFGPCWAEVATAIRDRRTAGHDRIWPEEDTAIALTT